SIDGLRMMPPTSVTRMSIVPNLARTASTKPCTSCSTVRSTFAVITSPLPPAPRISAARSANACSLRAQAAMLAPPAANATLIGRPKPPVAPASTTVFPVKSKGLRSGIKSSSFSFQPAQPEAARESTLQHGEEQEHRDGREHGNRHLLGRRIAVVVAELHQPERVGPHPVDRHDGQWPEELIPTVAK